MLIYNVTTKVSRDIAGEWLNWIKDEHIPDLMATKCFTRAIILHLLEMDDEEGITYAVQYYTESKALYNKYIEKFAPGMRTKSFDKWGERVISFRTLMQVVD